MPVQSIECLLTQAQVKRYLAGADFPDELLVPLEKHLKACPDCMAEANRQREALGGAPGEASAGVEPRPKSTLFQRLRKIADPKPVDQPLLANPGQNPDPVSALKTPRNLILSGSLAVVLVAMSLVTRNPASVFGPRALPAGKKEVAAAPKTPLEDKHTEHPADEPSKTTVASAHEPEVTQPVTEGHDPSGSHIDAGHEEVAPGAQPPVEQHGEAKGSEGHQEEPPVSTHKTATGHSTVEPSLHPEESHVKNAKPEPSHGAKAEHEKTPDKAHGTERPVTKLPKVGGQVFVAEAPHKAVSTKPVVARSVTRRRAKKPTLRTPKAAPVRKAASGGIRVYLPDGTPKH